MNNQYFIKRYVMRKRCAFGSTFFGKKLIWFQQNANHIRVAVLKLNFSL